ncbi:MAG: hypothetical protein F4X11_19115 [Acidobacteria bacterium]|nr:hypothetical protein [Acidobacteriota bacterium]
MHPKSAKELDAKWRSRPWYHRPSGGPGGLPNSRDDLNLRLRRALSWLERAEKEYETEEDLDAAFIFHWIAFNALYEQFGTSSIYRDKKEDEKRREYVGRIVAIQNSKSTINSIVWSVLRDEIQKMLENRFVYAPYWSHRNNPAEARNWKLRFDRDRKRALQALSEKRTGDVLCELFYRLNTLRNQLLHGGATWKGRVNRNQVEPGARIMALLVPNFIDVMIEQPNAGWGSPRYPVVREGAPLSGWTGTG